MESSQGPLVQFYLGHRADDQGRMIHEILSWDDELLEEVHDYIQWLFPLKEQSAFNATAPVLDDAQIKEFRANKILRNQLWKSFLVLLNFYGFSASGKNSGLFISPSDAFQLKAQNWLTPYNHNFLRITRILKSLTFLGLPKEASAFEKALEDIYAQHKTTIGEETLRYWRQAVA